MKIENKAAIVESDGQRQLQVDISTHLSCPKRMSVLMSMALEQVTGIEHMVSKAEASHIESLYEEYKKAEAVDAPEASKEEAKSLILGPDFQPATLALTP